MIDVLESAQSHYTGGNANSATILKEGLDNVKAMLRIEDDGWDIFLGGNGTPEKGLSLDDLKKWSERILEASVAGWMKQGFMLRDTYVQQDGGIQYDGIPGAKQGRGVNVRDLIDNPINQRAFFSPQARTRREKRLYSEGFALWVGDDKTKLLQAVPLSQVTDTLTDPDDDSIIYAYKREWSRRQSDGEYKDMVRWYFVDTYKDLNESSYITVDERRERIETGFTAFDMHANSVEGWRFGIPDALGAWIWNNYAKQAYMDGLDVTAAMASIIYSVSNSSAKGAQNAAVQLATPMGAGSTTVLGGGNAMSALSTAGNAYDFSKIREVVALIATSLSVSNIALTSNPGDAGSSYGSAQTLDLPVRLAIEMRRAEHVALDTRVLRWMAGPGKARDDIKVYYRTLADGADLYRKVQAVVLKWQQGLMTPEDAAEQIDDIFGIPSGYGIPEGVMIPNNKNSLGRKDVDADGQPAPTNGAQAAAPTQGRGGSQAGGSGERPKDTRSERRAA